MSFLSVARLFNPATAHVKKGKKVPGKTFCPDPQFRFVVDDLEVDL
jgi:hypothetical protein